MKIRRLEKIVLKEVNKLDEMPYYKKLTHKDIINKGSNQRIVFARSVIVILSTKYHMVEKYSDAMRYVNKSRSLWYNLRDKFYLNMGDNWKHTKDVIDIVEKKINKRKIFF